MSILPVNGGALGDQLVDLDLFICVHISYLAPANGADGNAC